LGRPVERWAYANPSPPMICRDVIVMGSAVIDWRVQNDKLPDKAPPGDVRGYDVHAGELLWTFHAIPREGEFGADTWEAGAWREFGGANVWSMISADHDLGYVYLPFSTPSNDFYGGDRPGDNLFGDSIVCLDARTGKRIWHYQLVHHGLWDLRHAGGASAVGHRRRRTSDKGCGAGDETEFLLRLRSRFREAGVADR